MILKLVVQPPYTDVVTDVTFLGVGAEDVVELFVAELQKKEYDVYVMDEDGKLISYEEYSYE